MLGTELGEWVTGQLKWVNKSLDHITVIYEHDLDILNFLGRGTQKLEHFTDRQTDTQTDRLTRLKTFAVCNTFVIRRVITP